MPTPYLIIRRFLVAIVCAFIMLSPVVRAETVSLTILHFNDFHAQLLPMRNGQAGAAQLAAYLKQVRSEEKNVLVLSAGDMVQGTPISTYYLGRPVFEVMNAMGVDAACLGNHEFDYGVELIDDYRDLADFPLISANAMHAGELAGDGPTATFTFGPLRVGLLGFTTPQAVKIGNEFTSPSLAMAEYYDGLKSSNDLVIALSHLGLGGDRKLAADFPEAFDAIISGHDHFAMQEPEFTSGTMIVQVGPLGTCVGRLDLIYDTEAQKIMQSEWESIAIPVEGLARDEATWRVVDYWESSISREVDIPIGVTKEDVPIKQLEREVARIWQEAYKTDFGYQNPYGTRAPLYAGPISIRDVYNALPFDNSIAVLTLTREQVLEILPEAEFTHEKEAYTVVTNSYAGAMLARQFDLEAERIRSIEESHRDSIVAYIKRFGALKPIPNDRSLGMQRLQRPQHR